MSLVLQLGLLTYVLHRLGWMSTGFAMALFAICVLGAAVSFSLALLALWQIWRSGDPGASSAGIALVLSSMVLSGALVLAVIVLRLPLINDVTTDTAEPPAFDIIASRRPSSANTVAYPGEKFAAVQRTAYPDIRPVDTRRSAAEAYTLAQAVATKMGWRVVAAGAPGEGGPNGEIEATDKTLIMGFVDDLAIRIKPLGEAGARIDIRSASRYGRSDLGRNASRIRDFLDQVRRAIEAGELTTAE